MEKTKVTKFKPSKWNNQNRNSDVGRHPQQPNYHNDHREYRRLPPHLYGRGGSNLGYYYPHYYTTYPLFIESPVIIQNTTSILALAPSPSISNEDMQNTLSQKATIGFPKKWDYQSEPPQCSLIQATWSDPIEKISSDPRCFCPVGNKVSKEINNQTLYKCQILLP
jgi:hypothetical protein